MFNKSKLTYQKQLIFLFGFLSCLTLWAQRPEADSFTVNGKALTIQPVLHGTLVMEYNGKVIYIDPYGGGKAFEGLKKPDLILITDIHGDHLNEKTLDELGIEGVSTVVPQAVADQIFRLHAAKGFANGLALFFTFDLRAKTDPGFI